jgi:hypothetical protein
MLLAAGAVLNPGSNMQAKFSKFVPIAAASRRLAPGMVRQMLDMGADPSIGSVLEDTAIFRALYAEDQPMFPFSVCKRYVAQSVHTVFQKWADFLRLQYIQIICLLHHPSVPGHHLNIAQSGRFK